MEALALLALLAGAALFLARRRRPPTCPRCGLPRALALEVARHRRFCPQVAFRTCPFDPRKGVYRQRR
ncbi:hypothetical protein [Thermus thermamylovorans]|uniref:Uncharacterized protein n=1 Tax=Thermus thermamylovorans TaxID=2509362 RepID=A0A4Q9B4C0_9DEIN|nr:hypothetical protein [Thermus thermamylovorans]TBH20642.1 hypothetical protein ETP66_06130 [Thermus thermamylovorans]